MENAKACQISKTLSKIIKENTDAPIKYLFSGFNNSPIKPEFPKFFKNADITPLFKKAGKNKKKNCRLVSIPPNVSKIFENAYFVKY